jgi:KipI family sensor histidine kinase inhibitor
MVDVDEAEVHGIARAVRAAALHGVVEVVTGACTVLVMLDASADRGAVSATLADAEPLSGGAGTNALVTLEVRYDGADLDNVAESCGLTEAEVVARHCGVEYEVAFVGFAPGFAYLRGLDPALNMPRLTTPRTRVPAGAVAIADHWSAVYPRESPGGWRLLGTTSATLWDLGRSAPALLSEGTRVRFSAVGP